MDKYPGLRSRQTELIEERKQVERRLVPKRRRYEDLSSEIEPLLGKQRELAREILESEDNQRLAAIDNELGALARALGGHSLTQGPRTGE